jgi:hypothetical protein
MKQYNPNCSVPAAAITYAGGLTGNQPILFTTQYGHVDTGVGPSGTKEDKYADRPLEWAINYIKVTIVRDWSSSIANIMLTSSIPSNLCDCPPLPNLSKIRGGNYPYLTVEDEIRIYMGFIGAVGQPITADMLDEIPVDLCPEGVECGIPSGESFKQDPNKPLCPVFWGFIDNISVSADIKSGYRVLIQCRDRTRVFSDTKIISIPALSGRSRNLTDKGVKTGLADGRREDILIQVARAATGRLFDSTGNVLYQSTSKDGKSDTCWKPVIGGSDLLEENKYQPGWGESGVQYKPSELGVMRYTGFEGDVVSGLTRVSPPEDPALWIREAMFKIMLPYSEPRFHMWVQRPPLVAVAGAAVFQIKEKTPIEVMTFLANSEERPTDFYASHVNGDFIFAPRMLDTSGFYDPNRFYRTYFYNSYPRTLSSNPPSPNQMIISMRSVTSSLAAFNRYVLIDATTEGASNAFLDKLVLSMETTPWSLDDRDVKPPCRVQIIYDGNLTAYGNEDYQQAGAAITVALSHARTWSKELQGIQITIMGDPTLYPNEAIRVYNTVLHDYATSFNPGTVESQQVAVDNLARVESLFNDEEFVKKVMTLSSNKKYKLDNFDSQQAKTLKDEANALFNSHMIQSNKDPDNLILPVYKIRSVQHTLSVTGNSPGFFTKLECIGDY